MSYKPLIKKIHLGQSVVAHAFNPSTGGLGLSSICRMKKNKPIEIAINSDNKLGVGFFMPEIPVLGRLKPGLF